MRIGAQTVLRIFEIVSGNRIGMAALRVAVFFLLALVGGVVVAYGPGLSLDSVWRWADSSELWAAVAFSLVYVIQPLLFLPGFVLAAAGGAVFGPLWGTFIALTGATVAAGIAFSISRCLGAAWMSAKLTGRAKQVVQGVEAEGWRFVAFVRLAPLMPFHLLNYAIGLTRLKATHFILSTYVFTLPKAFAYTYVGYTGHQLLTGASNPTRLLPLAVLTVAVLGAVLLLKPLALRWHTALKADHPAFTDQRPKTAQ
jgi:uncharacterized membrane protein YdjX (TVP38/TMEM64 family)